MSLALPTSEQVEALAPAELPAFAAHLAALLACVTLRLQTTAPDPDEVEAYDAAEAARRLHVSVDTLRENGEAWGVARIVTRDKRGTPTRVIYPRALLRAFLDGKPRPPLSKRTAA